MDSDNWLPHTRLMQRNEVLCLARLRVAVASGEAQTLRRQSGLTQEQLGEALGVTGAAISRWEAGDRQPRGAAALAYALLLEDLRKVTSGAA